MASSVRSVMSSSGGRAAAPAPRAGLSSGRSAFRLGGLSSASLASRSPAPPSSSAPRAATLKVQALFGLGKSKTAEPSSPFYGIAVEDIDGKNMSMSKFKGKVVLVTNVASECGFTPQYKGLAELYDKYGKQGLVVLGAPCNQFGSQEPGSNKEIKSFATKMGAKFPLTSKMDVNGSGTSDLYKYLKSQKGGLLNNDVKWNFSKFLVDREGNVVKRYFSTSEPAEIEKDIVALL